MGKTFHSAQIPEPFLSSADHRKTWDDCVGVAEAAQEYNVKWVPVLEQLSIMTHLTRSDSITDAVRISASAAVRNCLTQLGVHASKSMTESTNFAANSMGAANTADALALARLKRAAQNAGR